MQIRYPIRWLVCMTTCLLLILSALSLPIFAEKAEGLPPPDTADAETVYLYHLSAEQVLYEKNADALIDAGATAKMMAGYLACRELKDQLGRSLFLTPEMLESNLNGYYRFGLSTGDVIRVDQVLYLAICAGYNDAFDILAYLVSGSVEAFVAAMNREAAEMGLASTFFSDPTGIDDSSRTTAKELAEIAKKAYGNDLYRMISGATQYKISSETIEERTVKNRNELISSTKHYNAKCKGLCVGSTNRAGNCVVTVAEHNGEACLSIVMGARDEESLNTAYPLTDALVEWAFKAYTYREVISPDTLLCTIPVTVSDLTSEVEVRTKDSLSCLLWGGAELGTDVTYSIRLLHTELEAPFAEGTFVGYVAVIYREQVLGMLPLYTGAGAERSSFIGSLKAIQALTQNRALMAGVIFFVTVLTAWIVTETILARRRRHKWDKYFSDKMDYAPYVTRKKTK